jgi:hypothetical protein
MLRIASLGMALLDTQKGLRYNYTLISMGSGVSERRPNPNRQGSTPSPALCALAIRSLALQATVSIKHAGGDQDAGPIAQSRVRSQTQGGTTTHRDSR